MNWRHMAFSRTIGPSIECQEIRIEKPGFLHIENSWTLCFLKFLRTNRWSMFPLLVPKQKGHSAAICNPKRNSRRLKTNSIFDGLLSRPLRESLIVHGAFTSMANNLRLALHPHPDLRLLLLTPGIKSLIPRTFQGRTRFPWPFWSVGNYMRSLPLCWNL